MLTDPDQYAAAITPPPHSGNVPRIDANNIFTILCFAKYSKNIKFKHFFHHQNNIKVF